MSQININNEPSAEVIIYENGTPVTVVVEGFIVTWGDIHGNLSDQTDLQNALDGKVDENAPIIGATKTKITYDSKGLVTSGTDATVADISGLQNALDAKVPYSGATGNVTLGEYGISAGFVQLDTTPTTYTPAVGNLGYNDTVGTLETTLKGGNVSLKIGRDMFERVVNKTGVQLTKASYQAVRVSTAQGQRLGVALAQANNDNNSADTIGVAVETIDINQEGMIFTVGEIGGINTTGSLQGETWADGDVLYLSPTTAGRVTNVKPVAPQHLVVIGYVVHSHITQGKIYVKIMNGWELGELHDVNTTGATNGQVLTYNGSIWIPSTNGVGTVTSITASSPLTGGTITTSGTIGIPQATSSADGYLSSSDWSTFNSKQNALTNPVTGTGVSGQVSYWTGTTSQSGSNNLFWDAANNRLGVGTNSPAYTLDVSGAIRTTGLSLSTGYSFAVQRLQFNNGIAGNNIGYIIGTSNGVIRLINVAENDFTRLQFGGTTNSFPALQKVSSSLAVVDAAGTTTSNLLIGSTTDSGQRLQVTGTALLNGALTVSTGGAAVTGLSSFTGTTASDGGQLGSELLSSANWTLGAGWTGDFATGFTHSSGTATLTNTLAAVNGTYYLIAYTVTGRTAGSFSITFGGTTTSSITATGSTGPMATSTASLVITPTTDFNGTIVFSIKVISASSASIQLRNSSGTITNEIRNDSANTNTLIGLNAGSRNLGTSNAFIGASAGQNNTSGAQNSFFGQQSGQNNTIGNFNSFFGRNAGLSNSTGSNNTFIGINAGQNNTTGNNNAYFGRDAGRLISSGSALTIANNSVFIGSDTRPNADSESNQLVVGYTAIGLGSNTSVIGNSSTTFGRWWGNLLIGTSTNSGFALDVNGTARVQGNLTVSTGGITLTGAQTINTSTGTLTIATSAGNGNISLTPNGTGIVNIASSTRISSGADGLRIGGDSNSNTISTNTEKRGRINVPQYGNGNSTPIGIISGLSNASSNSIIIGGTQGGYSLAADDISFQIGSTYNASTSTFIARFFSTGNLLLQNGGTFTDAGFKLDVSGSARITNGLQVTGSMTVTSGSLTMPNRPAFRVSGSGLTGIPVNTILSGSAVAIDYNQGGHYNNTNGKFTAPIAGLYHVYFNSRTQTAGQQQVIIYKNTSIAQIMWETNADTGHFGVSSILSLAVNDTIEAKVTVGTIQFDGNDNWGAAYIG